MVVCLLKQLRGKDDGGALSNYTCLVLHQLVMSLFTYNFHLQPLMSELLGAAPVLLLVSLVIQTHYRVFYFV